MSGPTFRGVPSGASLLGRHSTTLSWGRMSRAERDAAYENTASVADSAILSAARDVASAAFRAPHPLHLDVRYGPRECNTWDLFPASGPDAPCIVFIHGGYWQRNS
jgi:arylformamidase